MAPLLEVRELSVEIDGARVVDQVSFTVSAGRLHALVGESGSGKSMTAYALMRLLPRGARIVGGSAKASLRPQSEVIPVLAERSRGREGTHVPGDERAPLDPVQAERSRGREAGQTPASSSLDSARNERHSGHPLERSRRGRTPDVADTLDLLALSDAEVARERGRRIAMMLQEPLSALSPVTRVGAQVAEALGVHQGLARKAAQERTIELLREVGIADPERRVDAYPHQLSGGMRQRVLLAAALACDPSVLIADEPTTALDATMRGVVLELLKQAAARRQLGVLLITHDLGVVRDVCDEVSVLYAGRIVERGEVGEVFASPQHPYTIGLLSSRPSEGLRGQPLSTMKGGVPQPGEMISGCRFNPRCPRAQDRCRAERPELSAGSHASACFFPGAGVPP